MRIVELTVVVAMAAGVASVGAVMAMNSADWKLAATTGVTGAGATASLPPPQPLRKATEPRGSKGAAPNMRSALRREVTGVEAWVIFIVVLWIGIRSPTDWYPSCEFL